MESRRVMRLATAALALMLASALLPGCKAENLKVSTVGPRFVELSWGINDQFGVRRDFGVDRRRSNEAAWTHIARLGTDNVDHYKDSTVTPGETYVYRIAAFAKGQGTTYSNEVTVTIPPRADLNSLSSADRKQLATLILQYVDDGVIAQHGHVIHGGPEIFPMHREMIGRLESYLASHGGSKFVPLPMWDPATPIPPEFNVVKPRGDGTPRQGLGELDPRSPRPEWLSEEEIRTIPTMDALANAVIPWHNQVHLNIAGIMVNLPEAPATPIFWCFHATVDDLYAEWLETHPDSGIDMTRMGHSR